MEFNFQNCKKISWSKQKTGGSVPLDIQAKNSAPTVKHQSQIKAHLPLTLHILPGEVKISIQEHNFIDYSEHTMKITMDLFLNKPF